MKNGIAVDNKPSIHTNAGRELRILAALQDLDLTSTRDICFRQAAARSRGWQVSGIAAPDMDLVTTTVRSIVPSAKAYAATGVVEWQNF